MKMIPSQREKKKWKQEANDFREVAKVEKRTFFLFLSKLAVRQFEMHNFTFFFSKRVYNYR